MQVLRLVKAAAIALALVLVLPEVALACPVCFGASDAPIVDGVRMAVIALLGITTVVLGGFAAFFVYLMRQSQRAQAASGGLPGSDQYAREGGRS
jgi:hypothetical protein